MNVRVFHKEQKKKLDCSYLSRDQVFQGNLWNNANAN